MALPAIPPTGGRAAFLYVGAGLAVVIGIVALAASKSAVHELVGLACLVIAALLFVGAVLLEALDRLRYDYWLVNGPPFQPREQSAPRVHDMPPRERRMIETHRVWHPYLRITRLVREILRTQWDSATWALVKPELAKALRERSRVERAGWFN
jgi:hypothetical protein